MGIFLFVYNAIFFQPLFNALVFLTGVVPFHDVGIAVIALTALVRLALFPFTHRSIKTQVKMKQIEPELRKIREEFKNNKEEQARRTMELYRQHGVSPFSGCLMLLVQLPILIALYRVFFSPIGPDGLYAFVHLPDQFRAVFLGLVDMGERSIILAVISAVSQYVQVKLASPPKQRATGKGGAKDRTQDFSRMLSFQTTYFLPVFILFVSLKLPAAVTLYWTASNIFAIVHESIVRRKAARIAANYDRTTDSGDKSAH